MAPHFVVTGEFLTDTARHMLLSERPASAWRLLSEALVGDGAQDVVVAIIAGDKRLIGDSDKGITVKPEKKSAAANFKKQARYIFAGRVRIDGAWYRPRAKVSDFGPSDVPEGMDFGPFYKPQSEGDYGLALSNGKAPHYSEALTILREFHFRRVAAYSRTGERVVEVCLQESDVHPSGDKRAFLIFEPTSEPPFWWEEHKTPEAALADFLASGHRLSDESWRRTRQDLHEMTEFETDFEPGEIEDTKLSIEAFDVLDWQRYLRETREKVLAQAAGDLFDLAVGDQVLKVPRAPFTVWALRRTSQEHLSPPWTAVARSGLKLPLDDPNHSDWMIGAGLDPREVHAYSGPLHDASMAAAFEVQQRLGGFDCAVLVGGAPVYGTVGKEIAVLLDLHPDRLDQLLSAKAVITQAGGELAHLAQVATEKQIPILRDPEALTRYPPGTRLLIVPDHGMIKIRSPQ